MSEIGHNTIAGGVLKAIVEHVEALEGDKKDAAEQIREVYLEAKSNGFDIKALRQLVKLRKIDATERQEQEAVLHVYMHALGMAALEDD